MALRWAVNVAAWPLRGGSESAEWSFLLNLLPPDEAARVVKFVHLEDRKRALVSQLLQRASCERALGVPFQEVVLSRTKGGKPFLASRAGRGAHAPNWNFNVSHEGDFVVLASEPLCVCGVDVAAPGQLRRKGAAQTPPLHEYVQLFRRQLTDREVEQVLGAGCEAERQNAFRKLWSLKEAFVKARGDGLAFELGRADFSVDDQAGSALLELDGFLQDTWSFAIQQLGKADATGTHWVTVARCHPSAIVDARGEFRQSLQKQSFSASEWELALRAPQPPFELLSVVDLLPPHARDAYDLHENA